MLILTFTAGGNRYAVDVARIIELVPRVELRAIPHAPGYLAGFLGYRGQVVPVIDLGLLLGAEPCPNRLSTRIILVNDASGDQNQIDGNRVGNLLGLIAERVSDLTRVRPEQIIPAPVHLPQAPYLEMIAQTDRGFVPLIAISKLSSVAGGSDRVDRDGKEARAVDL